MQVLMPAYKNIKIINPVNIIEMNCDRIEVKYRVWLRTGQWGGFIG